MVRGIPSIVTTRPGGDEVKVRFTFSGTTVTAVLFCRPSLSVTVSTT